MEGGFTCYKGHLICQKEYLTLKNEELPFDV